MVTILRRWSAWIPALSLLAVPACGGGGDGDDSTSGTSTAATTSGTTGPGTDPTTSSDPTTTSASAPTTSSDPTTDATTGPGTDPTTSGPTSDTTTDATTGDGTTSDGTTGTTGDDTTGGVGPEHIPEIPDDGMPSSAHHTKVPLGTNEAKSGYYEYIPPGYGGGELYPLLVFWHGIGENGNGDSELDKVLANGPPKLIKNDQWPKGLPFVVLSPQHPGGGCPSPTEIHDFLGFAAGHYDINPARIYLTGLSCGAIGSWNYLGQYVDEQIAAMVPIAGDGKGAFNQAMCNLGKVPLWAFHGDADGTVNVSGTTEPITKLQACDPKPDAEMVIYPGVGHDSWSMTYDGSAGHDIYAWLLAHYKML